MGRWYTSITYLESCTNRRRYKHSVQFWHMFHTARPTFILVQVVHSGCILALMVFNLFALTADQLMPAVRNFKIWWVSSVYYCYYYYKSIPELHDFLVQGILTAQIFLQVTISSSFHPCFNITSFHFKHKLNDKIKFVSLTAQTLL